MEVKTVQDVKVALTQWLPTMPPDESAYGDGSGCAGACPIERAILWADPSAVSVSTIREDTLIWNSPDTDSVPRAKIEHDRMLQDFVWRADDVSYTGAGFAATIAEATEIWAELCRIYGWEQPA